MPIFSPSLFFFFLSLMILTVVNTNNCTRLSKGRSWEKWSLSQRRIMLYNREEKHDCRERIYTYIISRIILPFFFFPTWKIFRRNLNSNQPSLGKHCIILDALIDAYSIIR